MTASVFRDDCRFTPYWWDASPRPQASQVELPKKADVVVVGAGYTGLSAALQTARGGRDTLVLDAEDVGWGCSTRNGGQISTSIKPGYAALSAKYGAARAFKIHQEGHKALAWIEEFIKQENIECNFEVVGKFVGAHNPAHYEKLARETDQQIEGLETDAYMLSRAEQHRELGSDLYHGGAVYPKCASVDPARLHQGLLARVLEAGASVIGRCAASGIVAEAKGFRVATARGSISCKHLIVASNGYSDATMPWLRRRIIPIGSYIIATEALAPALMERLIPRNRIVCDTRRVIFYYRASPDRRRILFGGRVSHDETNPRISGPKLHAKMVEIFPELAQTRISHSWMGLVGYTFDDLAHVGEHGGIHYAMGYCGSGVSMANYFGMRIGQQLLGLKQGQTAFDGLNFQTRPFYTGNPWFLSASVRYYQWLDRLNL